MTAFSIPFNRPFLVGRELAYVADALLVQRYTAGGGVYCQRCAGWLEQTLGTPKALLTPSCTAALEMAVLLSGIGPGDEVIVPSFTFTSTATCVAIRGAVPVFVDILPDTLNMDPAAMEAAITPRTKAVIVVHYAGYPCAMAAITAIARRHGLIVIEDAAQAILSRDGDRALGTIGDFGCLSFHETKNVICGEGGALLVNRPEMAERAEIIWEKGTNRQQMRRGETAKYSWIDIGSSYLPSDMNAAFLLGQLEYAGQICDRRRALHAQYRAALAPLSGRVGLPLPHEGGAGNGHIFHLVTASPDERAALITALAAQGIQAVFHYIPLHSSIAGRKYGRTAGDGLPVTDRMAERMVRLPLWYEMTDADVARTAQAVLAFYAGR